MLYVTENKPELAYELYVDLANKNNPDTWTAEAGIQAEELLIKYPKLRKPAPAAASPVTSLTTPPPTLTIPKK